MTNKRDNLQQVYFYAMLAAVVGGVYVRFVGLAEAPFWTDEYYLAQSIRNVLEHWLPEYDCGGYYTRGLLMQYLAAPFFKWGSNDEFYLRSIAVISNLLAIIPLFLLASRVAGKLVACAVVILFSLSVWEVEMARFARMYAPFQALFIWHVYSLHRVLFEKDRRALYWMYVVSLVSLFVYEGAIFLILLNFVPLAFAKHYRQLRNYTLPMILFVGAYLFLQTDMRRLGVEEFLPPDYSPATTESGASPIELPDLFLSTFPQGSGWITGFFVVFALCVALAVGGVRRELRDGMHVPAGLRAAAVIMCVFFALLNLYALVAAIGLFVYLLSPFGLGTVDRRSVLVCLIAVAVTLVFWLVYAASTQSWQALPDTDKASSVYRLALMLFNYPPIGFKIIGRWLDAMPLLTVTLGLLIGLGLYALRVQQDSRAGEYRMLAVFVLAIAFAMAALHQHYVQIRYTFFLYPLVLLLALASASRVATWMSEKDGLQQAVVLGATLGLIVIGEDFDPTHLWNIDTPQVLYRQDYNPSRAKQYYVRYDSRSPAEYVNTHRAVDDVIVASVVPVPYYLDRTDYFHLDPESHKFAGVVGCRGQKHLWSNARIIYEPEHLQTLLAPGEHTVWLIRHPRWRRLTREMPEPAGRLADQYREQVEYVSADGTIEVVRYLVLAGQRNEQR